jgi:triosephosphate isomerase
MIQKLIVANWKMNPQSLAEARELFNSVKNWIKRHSNVLKNIGIIICPPFVYLSNIISSNLRHLTSNISLGAQNLFWEEKGAFTGEISPRMLKNLGVEYVIVGHSERRQILGETDEMINKKLRAAIKTKLRPILCIGEKRREVGSRKYEEIRNQLKKALKGIPNSSFRLPDSLIIAYEPIWAIGTGNPCKPEDAKEVLLFLKKLTRPLSHLVTRPLILYGGSVNSKIAKDYIEVGFDGLLVGGASLDSKEFIEIIKSVSKY